MGIFRAVNCFHWKKLNTFTLSSIRVCAVFIHCFCHPRSRLRTGSRTFGLKSQFFKAYLPFSNQFCLAFWSIAYTWLELHDFKKFYLWFFEITLWITDWSRNQGFDLIEYLKFQKGKLLKWFNFTGSCN